jgi:CHASE2 domain-containing sensor protein
MKQVDALWRDTKFAWIGFAVLILIVAIYVSWLMLAMLAWLPLVFIYFAYMGYDKEGNQI